MEKELIEALRWALNRCRHDLPAGYFKGHPEAAGYDKALTALEAGREYSTSH